MASFLLHTKQGAVSSRSSSSHLFQRVASFLQISKKKPATRDSSVLISFREWLHSYCFEIRFEIQKTICSSHLFQRVASFLLEEFLKCFELYSSKFSSLSESGFIPTRPDCWNSNNRTQVSSHLFQRVASFLHEKGSKSRHN